MPEPFNILVPLFGLLIASGTVSWLAYTGVQVVRRKVLGEGVPGLEELEELRQRVAYLEAYGGSDEDLQARVAELEERLEFAERLLADNEPKQLPEGSDEVTAP